MAASIAYRIFKAAKDKGASDIHLKSGTYPFFRIEGQLTRYAEHPVLTDEMMREIANELMDDRHRKILQQRLSVDLAYDHPDIGRFRVNLFYQMNKLALVARLIPKSVKTIRELNLPPVIEKLAFEERGLILVTGTTGSGKSTTLAAMINMINREKSARIITIEDPIEYVFTDELSLISQREIGFDTISFAAGLRDALRQDPEIIMVGEMRDIETMETALTAAETGHLVMSTLHTLDAKETINRIINAFPGEKQNEVRVMLASVLKAAIAQRLIISKNGKRIPAVEILVNTPRVREIIADPNRFSELYTAIEEGFIPYGMQTFEQSLFYLWKRGLIDEEIALEHATRKDDLKLIISGVQSSRYEKVWKPFEDLALKELQEEQQKEAELSPETTFFGGTPSTTQPTKEEETKKSKDFDIDELLNSLGG